MKDVDLKNLDYPIILDDGSHLRIMTDFLIKKKNPIILELGELKNNNIIEKIVVMGCFSERFPKELKETLIVNQ